MENTAPERNKQVWEKVTYQDELMILLHNTLKTLEEKLDWVLRPGLIDVDKEWKCEELVHLADRLNNNNKAIEYRIEQINSILSRIEV